MNKLLTLTINVLDQQTFHKYYGKIIKINMGLLFFNLKSKYS